MSKWYVLISDLCQIQYFIFQNIEIVTSSDIRHAALQRQAKVLRMVSNTRIIGHNHRWLTKREKVSIINLDSGTESYYQLFAINIAHLAHFILQLSWNFFSDYVNPVQIFDIIPSDLILK